MERHKFYKIIDANTEGWYIDANPPVRGTYKTAKVATTGPRKKTNHDGEEYEPNLTTGEVQVLKWARPERMCVQCCKMACDRIELINLKNGQVKCSCGLKYPLVNLETIN